MREALLHMRLEQDTARRVCRILENCRKGEEGDEVEFRIVCDSQALAKLAVEHFAGSAGEWENLITASLRTETAKGKARGLFHS